MVTDPHLPKSIDESAFKCVRRDCKGVMRQNKCARCKKPYDADVLKRVCELARETYPKTKDYKQGLRKLEQTLIKYPSVESIKDILKNILNFLHIMRGMGILGGEEGGKVEPALRNFVFLVSVFAPSPSALSLHAERLYGCSVEAMLQCYKPYML